MSILLLVGAGHALAFRPTALFGDHMVIQATDPSNVSQVAYLNGYTGPDQNVTVEISAENRKTERLGAVANANGKWRVGVKGAMNDGPFTITISSMGDIRIARDVWFGNVLLCTGIPYHRTRADCCF